MKVAGYRLTVLIWTFLAPAGPAGPAQDAEAYTGAISKINDAHARQPGKNKEADLAKQLPPAAKSALKRVFEAKTAPELPPALLRCGEAALDLDQMDDFVAVRTKLAAGCCEAGRRGVPSAVHRPGNR